jgi:multiple sugar transport system substrate-binding protein
VKRIVGMAGMIGLVALLWAAPSHQLPVPRDREEVVFWHFWGGADRDVVERIVARFNAQQDRYFVRPVAMPGNNLDLKLFLAVTGGDPPDLINQDDPIMADWASRGALMALDEIASPAEVAELDRWLVPAARQLATYQRRYYALCNGLDVRALYYNKSLLDELNLAPPSTHQDLDRIAELATRYDADGRLVRCGYLPDPRRLWAWGVVFGGDFYDELTGRATVDSPQNVAALRWMTGYRERYGDHDVAAFRQGDQSLPGKTFPLLADRYAVVMDGQWRVRDIEAFREEQRRRGEPSTEYAVCPLPPPSGGRQRAGWVNGNLFLVPRNAGQPKGAWEFMKFWCGFAGQESEAVRTCIDGGWIPVSTRVIAEPAFQTYLQTNPLMAQFVDLASSDTQIPTPVVPGAAYFQRTVNNAAAQAMFADAPPARDLLRAVNEAIQTRLDTGAHR